MRMSGHPIILRSFACMIGWIMLCSMLDAVAENSDRELQITPFESTANQPVDAVTQQDLREALDRISELEAIVESTAMAAPILVSESHDVFNDESFGCPGSIYSNHPAHSTHHAVYDGGWTWRPHDASQSPFELKINLHNQFRHTGFSRTQSTYTDAAGNLLEIADRNDFDINRGRLIFSGYAFDEDLGFYTNIDYSTVTADPVQLLMGWISFRMSDQLRVYLGLGKVPGTWEWLETSRHTLGADRTMATTFFRPSITAGIWAKGQLTDTIGYQLFVGNGINTLSLQPSELDTHFAYSAFGWWEPLEAFGPGFSDLENHPSLAIRIGHGLPQTRNESNGTAEPAAEQTVIRLSDGTRLIEPNAVAPGITVDAFDLWLYSVHLGMKKNGFSFSGELFLRWLNNLEGNTGAALPSMFDHGYFAQGAAFVIPKKLEVFVRGSLVNGEFGSSDEVSVGTNWYLFNERSARFTFDVTTIDDSPAQQSRTGYVAGQSGTLFRSQLWTYF